MGSHELAPELQERLRATLGSYEELQLLLHALRRPGPWSIPEAARTLHLEESPLNEALGCLVRAGFLVATLKKIQRKSLDTLGTRRLRERYVFRGCETQRVEDHECDDRGERDRSSD